MSNSSSGVGEILRHFLHGPQAAPTKRVIRAEEREFLERVHKLAEEHLADPLFTTSDAAGCLDMSRMHLNRRLRTLTGKSTHQLLREMRLESAREVLAGDPSPIAVVATRVGFKSVSQFTKAFRLMYGAPPGEYRKLNPVGPPPREPRP